MTATACDVIFHDLQSSPALDQLLHERANWLQQFSPTDIAVRALIDAPYRHRHKHAVRIQLNVNRHGDDAISVERERVGHVYALVTDTFDVARRRIQDSARERRGCVKSHRHFSRRLP